MKTILLGLILFSGMTLSQAQTLKKKFCGEFIGEIPSYTMDFDGKSVPVKATSLRLILDSEGNCEFIINGKASTGIYHVIQEDNVSFTINASFDKDQAGEEWVIYKKDKRLVRKGVYPQPNAYLTKKV